MKNAVTISITSPQPGRIAVRFLDDQGQPLMFYDSRTGTPNEIVVDVEAAVVDVDDRQGMPFE